jgi:hypothetical protein
MIQATLPRRGAQPFDLSQVDLNQLARDAMQPWANAFDSWRTGVNDVMRAWPTSTHARGCGCPTCLPDPCNCKCCVTDADLVIEGRVGERRIVPIVIENRWRREREIELDLSDFSKVTDAVTITADILGPKTFTLAPCGQQEVVLVVNYTTAGLNPQPAPNPTLNTNNAAGKAAAAAAAREANANATIPPDRKIPDVDRCIVAYADLRVKGCDLRSIRIAVAVLPRTCEPFVVDCGCACCC